MLQHKALAAAGYDGKITVSPEAKEDLFWWSNNLSQWNGHTMVRVGSQVAIETDASRAGWGAFCQGEATGGCWSREEQLFHINVLERLAVFLCPESVLKECGRGFCSNTVRQYVCGVPEAVATDAFSQSWATVFGFAHPPWCLFARLLMKV